MGADGGQAFALSLHRLLAGVCVLIAIAAIVFGTWLRRLAEATRRDRRWPPSTMRTSSDVRVRYLTSADALVTQFRAGSVALFVVAAMLLAWAAWMVRSSG
jgi:sterol desaturase/sphingolipid hydroxylase (fatty acid hydroxylase superfamily)